ncbi:hypothetical protein GO988_10410 [Hymenobacter sp. HMF4947]|uniref:Uncharacterized protein n=1 Tax=Hymenobacter ginkgonis TaxID=2682976 RepID=A0A7K1TE85_9BACT|nr:hypothetical protein [Hymenobacter ginkgonis]
MRCAWSCATCRPAPITLTQERTGYERYDAYSAYLKAGRPAQLRRAQEAQLWAATQPAAAPAQALRVSADGRLFCLLVLRQNDVVLLRPRRQR